MPPDAPEAEHEMQEAAHSVDKVRVDADLGDRQARGHHQGAHGCTDGLHVIVAQQVGDLASVQDVVDVLQEGLLQGGCGGWGQRCIFKCWGPQESSFTFCQQSFL